MKTTNDRIVSVNKHKKNWEENFNNLNNDNSFFDPNEDKNRIRPRLALLELKKAMPDNAIVTTDIGNICSVSNSFLDFNTPRSFFAALTYGNCGFAIPGAIGAKVGSPERPVIA
jgi:sulfoacetaldehyde acetyltransferase